VDGSGNVFVADTYNSAIKEILAIGGYATVKTLFTDNPLMLTYGVALDANGNLYFTEYNGRVVFELLAAGGYTTVQQLGSVYEATSIALDANGDIFATSNAGVQELLATGGYATINSVGNFLYRQFRQCCEAHNRCSKFWDDYGWPDECHFFADLRTRH
jgi:outer membrane protein assembly factor BamB